MTYRNQTLVAGALVAVLLASGAALAQGRGAGPGGPGGPGRAGGPMGRGGALPLAALNLNQSQQDVIRDMRERHRDATQALEQRLREAHQAQQNAANAIPANENTIRAATLALAEIQADIAIQQARLQNEIWSILTPDQQQEAKTLRAQQDERRAQAGERRRTRQ
jgi:Spy/CpxP family protein refolding chaperone